MHGPRVFVREREGVGNNEKKVQLRDAQLAREDAIYRRGATLLPLLPLE